MQLATVRQLHGDFLSAIADPERAMEAAGSNGAKRGLDKPVSSTPATHLQPIFHTLEGARFDPKARLSRSPVASSDGYPQLVDFHCAS